MPETRPSGVPIISAENAVVFQETADIDRRGRLRLLPRWIVHIDWIPITAKEDVSALMILDQPGRISLRNWEVLGPQIEGRYEEIAGKSEDDHNFEALRLIQDRYQRLIIPKDRRPYLGKNAIAHLGLQVSHENTSTVYVAIFPGRLDVLSPSYRNEKLRTGDERIADLP
jgi:hypothetical protein